MSDSAALLAVLIGCAVFIVVFGLVMLYFVRRQGVERRRHGKLTRGNSSVSSNDSSIV